MSGMCPHCEGTENYHFSYCRHYHAATAEEIRLENPATAIWEEEKRQGLIKDMAARIYEQAMSRAIAEQLCADNAISIAKAAEASAELWFAVERRV